MAFVRSKICVTKQFRVSLNLKVCLKSALIKMDCHSHFFPLSQRITNAAFFFSAISAQEKKNGSINGESDNSEDDQEASPIPVTSSWQLVNGNTTLVNKLL